jgi:hypothetical protein
MERLATPAPASDPSAEVLDLVMQDDVRHAVRILACLLAMDAAADDVGATDEPLRRAIGDEFDLVCQRVKAGRLARYGAARLGPPMVELDAGGSSSSLAVEALQVLLAPSEAKQVLALLERDLPVAERLARLPPPAGDAPTDLVGWLRDLVEDVDDHWRSPWLRATAIHAAKARNVLDQFDLDPARSLGDPTIDELLA